MVFNNSFLFFQKINCHISLAIGDNFQLKDYRLKNEFSFNGMTDFLS